MFSHMRTNTNSQKKEKNIYITVSADNKDDICNISAWSLI